MELSTPTAHQQGLGGVLCLGSPKQRCDAAGRFGSERGKAGGASGVDGRAAEPCPAGNWEGIELGTDLPDWSRALFV